MQQHIFQFESEASLTEKDSSSHCSSVQERLATYGSEALNSIEHLGLIVGSQLKAEALLQHFGSLTALARATVQELLPFVSRAKALRPVSSLRMGAVALREERQSLTIDSPVAIAALCSEMRFLDRESLRVVLLDAKQHLIKVATISQGAVMRANCIMAASVWDVLPESFLCCLLSEYAIRTLNSANAGVAGSFASGIPGDTKIRRP